MIDIVGVYVNHTIQGVKRNQIRKCMNILSLIVYNIYNKKTSNA